MATKGFEYSLFSELSSLGDTAGSKLLISNLVDIVKPIAKNRSLKSIEVALNRALPSYFGIKMIILGEVNKSINNNEEMKKIIPDLNGDIMDAFSKSDLELFSAEDRQCLLAVLQENVRLVEFTNSVPKANQEAQRNVFIQGFENLQKLDILMTTISLIVLGLITPKEKKTIHRLCLSAQEHLKEFQHIVFINSPLLTDRLKSKSKTISNDKMEQLLGLSN